MYKHPNYFLLENMVLYLISNCII